LQYKKSSIFNDMATKVTLQNYYQKSPELTVRRDRKVASQRVFVFPDPAPAMTGRGLQRVYRRHGVRRAGLQLEICQVHSNRKSEDVTLGSRFIV
jgi:hypothetical protein